eukprot:11096929-Karenia_brevis.AAC.1
MESTTEVSILFEPFMDKFGLQDLQSLSQQQVLKKSARNPSVTTFHYLVIKQSWNVGCVQHAHGHVAKCVTQRLREVQTETKRLRLKKLWTCANCEQKALDSANRRRRTHVKKKER